MALTQVEAETHMQGEILSQPECWSECLSSLENDPVAGAIVSGVDRNAEWLFLGCGSSYYLALSAAASFSAICGRASRAANSGIAGQLRGQELQAKQHGAKRAVGMEWTRLAASIPWGQMLGLYTGLKKGLNPDAPRNLSQVVILDEIS